MPKLSRTNTAKWDEKKSLWRIVVTRDGKRKEFTSAKPGRTGQREANKKADAWLNGTAPAERLRVRDAYGRYSEAQIGLRSTSNDKDIQTKGDTWILPYIGSKYLDALTLGDLQAILDDADRKGKSRKTIRNIRGRLSHFFRFCRQHGWTNLRTDDLTVSDHAPVKHKTILQPEALRILFSSDLTFYGKSGSKVEPYIHAYRFQVLTVLRPGELLGLKWLDIHEGVLYLQRAINYFGEETRGKNDNAIRSIPLNSIMCRVLQDQKDFLPNTEYIFENITSETNYLKHWHLYCAYNQIAQTTVYELRHTFVSVVSSALPEGAVKQLVGHSRNMDTFGIYGHAVNGDAEQTARMLDGRFAALLNGTDREKAASGKDGESEIKVANVGSKVGS